MSIQSQLNKLERSNESTKIKSDRVIEYLQSDKVKQILATSASNLKTLDSSLSESNQNFKLYIHHDKLEMFRYETRISEVPKFRIPCFDDSTKEIKTVDIGFAPSFVLRFDGSDKLEITKLDSSLSSDEVIENLEDLLFSN